MSKNVDQLRFAWIDGEKAEDLVETFGVETIPSLVLVHPGKAEFQLITDLTPELLNDHVKTQADSYAARKAALNARLLSIISSNKVMLFIKGSMDAPKCKFTRQLVDIFAKYTDISYGTFDILADNDVREGLKLYSKWPTYPQIYVNSQLIGGVDIVKELDEEGELAAALTAQ